MLYYGMCDCVSVECQGEALSRPSQTPLFASALLRKGSLQEKKREIVCFFTKGGVPPHSLVQFTVFSSEKTGNPLEVWFSTAGGYPPPVW